MLTIIRNNINGILGTLSFHLLILVIFMATRLSSSNKQNEISLLIEFDTDVSEEQFRAFTESLQRAESYLLENERGPIRRNIAVNISEERPVPDQFKEMSSEQLTELDHRVNEILNNAANGNIKVGDQPEFDFELQEEKITEENNNDEPYQGPTTITYDLQGRKHLRMPVPVYKCPDGGVVSVNISVDRMGRVIRADIEGTPGNFNEICIFETAMESAYGSRFSEKSDAPSVQSGTITFYFQKQ